MNIRLAKPEELDKVQCFYYYVTDWLETVPYGPGWKKDIYPSPEELTDALAKNELWVCETEEEYIASMILNNAPNEGYEKVKWKTDAKPDEVMLIHALGVKPEYQGKGIATKMVEHAINIAESNNCKAMRLDVLEGNLPAERLYPKLGFAYVETVEMYYEDTGNANYELFELVLQ